MQVIIIAAVALFAIGGIFGGGGSSGSRGDMSGAENACKDWVKDQLNAPAPADFTSVSSSGPDTGPWTVTGDRGRPERLRRPASLRWDLRRPSRRGRLLPRARSLLES